MTRQDIINIAKALAAGRPELGHVLHGNTYYQCRKLWEKNNKAIADVLCTDDAPMDRNAFIELCEELPL